VFRTIIVKMFHKALDCDVRSSVTESDVKFLSPVARRVVTQFALHGQKHIFIDAPSTGAKRGYVGSEMDRERIVGKPEVIQAEPISNDSSESNLVGGRTASARCVVKKLVRAFQNACSVSSVE
jgi:hypothetical protein